MAKKMINKSHVEGLVYENELKLNKAGEKAKNPGMEYISGKIFIEIMEGCVIPVEMYESALTSKGAENKKFGTAKSLLDVKTVVADGRENAQGIKIDSAISLNDWYKDNELISTPRNFGGFVHLVSAPTPSATFETDMVITATTKEQKKLEDETLEETGRLIVNGIIFDFANKALPVKFIVANPQGVSFFEGMAPMTFTKVWGNQESSTFHNKKVEENAFGESKVTESEYTRREFVITGTSKDPYTDESLLSKEEFQKALSDRQVYLAEKKASDEARAMAKANAASGAAGANKGGNALSGLNVGAGGFNF